VAFAPSSCAKNRSSAACTTITVTGAGADISGQRDEFSFVHRQLVGDGVIVARVSSLQLKSNSSKAGLMIRESLEATARHAFVSVSAGNGLAFQRRSSPGGASAQVTGGPGTSPIWLKLERQGNTLTAFRSGDGTVWARIGTETLSLPLTVHVGLAVTSATVSATTTGVFSQVAVSMPPSKWITTDVGRTVTPGNVAETAGTFIVSTASRGIGAVTDGLTFHARFIKGDVDIITRVAGIQGTSGLKRAGIMLRESLDDDAAFAALVAVTPRGAAFQRRLGTGFPSLEKGATKGGFPMWLKVERRGDLVSTFTSTDGRVWTFFGSEVLDLPPSIFVGLTAWNPQTGGVAIGVFDNTVVRELQPPVNQRPVVELTAPVPDALLDTGNRLVISADADDADGAIAGVDFYAEGTWIGSAFAAPYSITWTNTLAGIYRIAVVVRDNDGDMTTSVERKVTFRGTASNNNSNNQAPDTDSLEGPQYQLAFTSADHYTLVDSYIVDVFAAGANPNAGVPVRRLMVGKPSLIDGEVMIDVTYTLASLPSGTYFFSVTAVGYWGSSRSAPSPPFVH
jgi:hypothetical protein